MHLTLLFPAHHTLTAVGVSFIPSKQFLLVALHNVIVALLKFQNQGNTHFLNKTRLSR